MRNKKFQLIESKFKFIGIRNTDHARQCIQELKQTKLIIIDLIRKVDQNDNILELIFLVCFDKIILIIDSPILHLFQPFFTLNKNSSFYFLHKSKEYFGEFIKTQYKEPAESSDDLLSKITPFQDQIHTNENKFFQPTIFSYLQKIGEMKLRQHRIQSIFEGIDQEQKYNINIDDFIEIRSLGGGSSAHAFLNYNLTYEKFFAIKKFDMQNEKFEKDRLSEREIKNYQEINHPFIPKFYGTIENKPNEPHSIVIDYIEGQNLQHIKKLKLNDELKLKIIFQIMIVIEYLQNLGFAYRDLKPNNVILDSNKTIALIDFDRMIKIPKNQDKNYDSKDTNDVENKNVDGNESAEFTKSFSSFYVAPELDSDIITNKCDVYSIGMMIIYIIQEKKICDKVEINFPSKFDQLAKMCKKCIIQNPKLRPNISEIINDFYDNYFSVIHTRNLFKGNEEELRMLSESDTIHSKPDIHSNSFSQYWICLSEYSHPVSLFYFIKNYVEGNILPQNLNKYVNYMTYYVDHSNPDPTLIFQLGCILYENIDIERDIKKAIHYITIAADLGNSEAQYKLGLIYSDPKSGYFDFSKSYHYMQLSAENKNIEALKRMGEFSLYQQGNIDAAINYYSVAAEQNDVKSYGMLGFIYINFTNDTNKGLHYLNLAAAQKDIDSLKFLGSFYVSKNYGPIDVPRSIHYFRLAAAEGDAEALLNLGLIYYKGEGIKKDIRKAMKYLEEASELGDARSASLLGITYLEGKYVNKNIELAFLYFSRAAEKRYPEAQNYLGIIYYEHMKDVDKAIHYFTLAANQNYKNAQYHLGMIYLHKKPVDIKRSLYYLMLSIQESPKPNFLNKNIDCSEFPVYKRCTDSFLILGCLYHLGRHVKKDVKKAISFYKEASSLNNQYAKNNLGVIYKIGDGVNKNLSTAIEYFKEAVEKSDVLSMYNLASLYFFENYNNFDESLNLLIKSLNLDREFYPSIILISLIVIKKYDNISFEVIKKEFDKYQNKRDEFPGRVFNLIQKFELKAKSNFDKIYQKFQGIYFVYFDKKSICSDSLKGMNNNNTNNEKLKDINNLFYEGFGIDL